MKEQIYTIPVNEAYDSECECPLCFLEHKLENEYVEYSLGAAMMEPDYRIRSNNLGFCNKHLSQMLELPNKLSLALLLDTHLTEVRKKLELRRTELSQTEHSRTSLFKKPDIYAFAEKTEKELHSVNSSCIICDHIKHTMDRYIKVIFYMWTKDNDFKSKFKQSKGLCLKHFEQLAGASRIYLDAKHESNFINVLLEKQIDELNRIQDDIHRFTLKFDYRNRDMEWGTAEDAPKRTAEKISGFIHNPK